VASVGAMTIPHLREWALRTGAGKKESTIHKRMIQQFHQKRNVQSRAKKRPSDTQIVKEPSRRSERVGEKKMRKVNRGFKRTRTE
jgi:hypothetical protein